MANIAIFCDLWKQFYLSSLPFSNFIWSVLYTLLGVLNTPHFDTNAAIIDVIRLKNIGVFTKSESTALH